MQKESSGFCPLLRMELVLTQILGHLKKLFTLALQTGTLAYTLEILLHENIVSG